MQTPPSADRNEAYGVSIIGNGQDAESVISWSAIFGGTFVIVALSLVLIALGAGMDFASSSPWSHEGISAKHFTYISAVWLIIVQWVSSGLGGYLTGRLRTRWMGVHTHEVFFRDTAHGFLTWAVATVVSVLILLFAMSTASSGNNHMMNATHIMQSRNQNVAIYEDRSADITSYNIDNLFRGDQPHKAIDPETKSEISHILANTAQDGSLSDVDKAYLAQLVSAHTGLTLQDSEKSVDSMIGKLHQSAVEARKTAATISIYTFLSMLIGAFIASAAAALGGHERDEPRPVTQCG
jgi:hypothetical protein